MFKAFSLKHKNWNPFLILRLGLGSVFLYAGVSILSSPGPWIGFVPSWLKKLVSVDNFLAVHGVFEILIGVLLIAGLFVRIVSLIAFLDLAFILVFSGIDLVTFRDLGLIAASLALFVKSLQEESGS